MMHAVPTFGWDIVYAVRLPEVNARIAEREHQVHTLSCVIDNFPVSASLGRWRLVPGGSGDVVWVSIDITNGQVAAENKPPLLFHGEAVVEVKLHHAIAETEKGWESSLNVRQPDPVNAKDVAAIMVRRVDLAGSKDLILKSLVDTALQQWLNVNPGVIEHIFAVVDLTDGLGAQPFAWLRPTATSYAYTDATDPENCVFAVLAMVDKRNPEGLDQQVAAFAIPEGCNAAILISPHLLLDGIIRHAVPGAFSGVDPGDLDLSVTRPVLTLRKPKTLKPIMHDNHEREHLLTSLTVEFMGTELRFFCENAVVIKDRLTLYTQTRITYTLRLAKNDQGGTTFNFESTGEPEVSHRSVLDPDFAKNAERAALAMQVVATVVGIATGGVGFVILTIEGALLWGMMTAAPQLAVDLSTTAPSMELLASSASVSCVWAGGHMFQPESIDLVESLRVSGSLQPAGGAG